MTTRHALGTCITLGFLTHLNTDQSLNLYLPATLFIIKTKVLLVAKGDTGVFLYLLLVMPYNSPPRLTFKAHHNLKTKSHFFFCSGEHTGTG